MNGYYAKLLWFDTTEEQRQHWEHFIGNSCYFEHYSSTAVHPKHNECPNGVKSLCSYQRDITLSTNNHKCIQCPLPSTVVQCIQPVFDRLGKMLMNYIF